MKWPHALLALSLALGAADARAHASLVHAAPADGAVLREPPAEVVLRFDEPVSLLAVRILDDSGRPIALPAAPRAEGPTLHVQLPPRMREGTYLVSYRLTSADSHPVGGSVAFSVGHPSANVHAEAGDVAGRMAWAFALRGFRDLALLIAAGGALFVLFVAPFPGERPVLAIAGITAAGLATAGIGLHGVTLLGEAGILDGEPWRIALRTSYGTSAMAVAGSTLVIAGAAPLPRGAWRSALLFLGAGAAAASLPLTGHAVSAGAPALARVAVGTHALAAAFWTGSLVALFQLLRRAAGGAAPALRRFSSLALVAVAALVAAGAAFAFLQLASFTELIDTRYGNLLLAKMTLAVLLIAVAVRNRYSLLPALEQGAAGASRRLQRAIGVEIGLVVFIVAVTAVLVQTPPRPERIVKSLAGVLHTAELTTTPGRAGHNVIVASVRDRAGNAFDPAEVFLEIANPAAVVEPIIRPLARTAPGEYRYEGSDLAFPGAWRIALRMRIDDFEQVKLDTNVDIR